MLTIINLILVAILAAVSITFAFRTRTLRKENQALRQEMTATREVYDWAQKTSIIVRDKVSHEFVSDTTLLTLFWNFKNGEAFRGAKLLFDHLEFKVFAQQKGEQQ